MDGAEGTYADFCTELRERTKTIHDKSDKLVNLKLAAVLTDQKLYGHVLGDFYHVFRAIENALHEKGGHPHVLPLIHHDLERSVAFQRDLQYYLGDDWQNEIKTPSPAAQGYVDRINQVATENPSLLIAYAHSMYLAILAGGQIIKKIVKRTLGLQGTEGLAVFDFNEGVDRKELKTKFMDGINKLELDRDLKERIIQEKVQVFKMNNAIASSVRTGIYNYRRLVKLFIAFIIILILVLYVVHHILNFIMLIPIIRQQNRVNRPQDNL